MSGPWVKIITTTDIKNPSKTGRHCMTAAFGGDSALRQLGPLPPAGFWEAERLKVITKKVEKWCVTLLVGSLFYIL